MDSFGYYNVLEDLSLEQIKHKLKPFLLWLVKYYELVLLKRDPDYRSGLDTYGHISEEDDDDTIPSLPPTDDMPSAPQPES